jgi:hypothetical protein
MSKRRNVFYYDEVIAPNQALPPKGEARRVFNKLTEWAWVQFTLRVKFLMLNNLFCSVNSLRWLHDDSYQRRSGAERHVPLSAESLAGILKEVLIWHS